MIGGKLLSGFYCKTGCAFPSSSGAQLENDKASESRRIAAIGCSAEEIGVYFGVSRQTICARFGRALEKGRALRKRLLRQKQTEAALAGNPAMLIWLGKQELGQRNIPLEISGPYAPPLAIKFFDAILAEKERRKLGGKQGEVSS